MHHLCACDLRDLLTGEMMFAADARSAISDLSRIRLCIGDELAQIARRQRGCGDKDCRRLDQLRNWCEVLCRIEGHGFRHEATDHLRGGGSAQQVVAIGCRASHLLGCQDSAGAGVVFHHQLLPQDVRKRLRKSAQQRVAAGARAELRDQAHRLGGVGLRQCKRRNREKAHDRQGVCCEMHCAFFHGLFHSYPLPWAWRILHPSLKAKKGHPGPVRNAHGDAPVQAGRAKKRPGVTPAFFENCVLRSLTLASLTFLLFPSACPPGPPVLRRNGRTPW